jgi:hypothetical protein
MTNSTKYPFIDAAMAAELTGVAQSEILEWIEQGRLQRYGGKERNPFVRTADVQRLAGEIGRTMATTKQPRSSQNPVRRIQLRLRADARWNEVSGDDIAEWLDQTDEPSRAAAVKVARVALDRLNALLEHVEQSEGRSAP